MSIGLPRNTLHAMAPLDDEMAALVPLPSRSPCSPLSRCLSRSRHAEALTRIFDVCICTFRGRKRYSYRRSRREREKLLRVARAFAVLLRGEDVRRLRRAECVTRKSLLRDRSEWILLVGCRKSLSAF